MFEFRISCGKTTVINDAISLLKVSAQSPCQDEKVGKYGEIEPQPRSNCSATAADLRRFCAAELSNRFAKSLLQEAVPLPVQSPKNPDKGGDVPSDVPKENRIEAHIFVAYLAHCLHVTLQATGSVSKASYLSVSKASYFIDQRRQL